MSICTSLARGAVWGTKMTARRPAAAQTAAKELAALPVEAQTMVVSFRRAASAATRSEARSLSEPLGLSPSFLIQSLGRPRLSPSRGAGAKGVCPAG